MNHLSLPYQDASSAGTANQLPEPHTFSIECTRVVSVTVIRVVHPLTQLLAVFPTLLAINASYLVGAALPCFCQVPDWQSPVTL
jgi:hypothetical protein